MALLLLTVVRGDLMHGLAQATPPDAPNQFVFNIQPDQRDAARAAPGSQGVDQPLLYPMIRGSLVR
jgi:putative ABC transport system permease protein